MDKSAPLALKDVDVAPEFPGGMDGMIKYLSESIKYPKDIEQDSIEGVAYVAFQVTPTGKVDHVKLTKGFHSSADQEALRVVNSMPDWKPAMFNGEAVAVEYVLPIRFKMQ